MLYPRSSPWMWTAAAMGRPHRHSGNGSGSRKQWSSVVVVVLHSGTPAPRGTGALVGGSALLFFVN